MTPPLRKRAYVENYGCSQNQAEGFMAKAFLRTHEYGLVNEAADANVVVINTCAVKSATEEKMMHRIKQLHLLSQQTHAKLLVTGCLPAIHEKRIRAISKDIELPGTKLEALAQALELPLEAYCPDQDQQTENSIISIIPISVGCLSQCTFCATRFARGVLKSYPVESIIQKMKNEYKVGKREFWLTSTDCGCYGFDQQTNLAKLLKKVLNELPQTDYRIRVGMANPQHLKFFFSELVEVFNDERLYQFLHIPLQSGSATVLKDMLRHYSPETFLDMVHQVRSRYPSFTIATDIIVGFPTETQTDFEATIRVIKQADLDIVNISKFGARPNTKAAQLHQLDPQIMNERSQQLTVICNQMIRSRNERMKGVHALALASDVGKNGRVIGRLPNYKPIPVNAPLGQLVSVKVEQAFRTHVEEAV